MRRKILVVEDNPDQVELLSFNLKRAGYSVGTAKDGIEALKKARSLQPDLILLDLMLPELDGFAVCEILRGDPVTASVPIIMLTAVSSALSKLAGLGAGANDYLIKPFALKDLLARIERALPPTSAREHSTAEQPPP